MLFHSLPLPSFAQEISDLVPERRILPNSEGDRRNTGFMYTNPSGMDHFAPSAMLCSAARVSEIILRIRRPRNRKSDVVPGRFVAASFSIYPPISSTRLMRAFGVDARAE